MTSDTFTRSYLLDEIVRFRQRMGEASFWQGGTPDRAMRGLLFVYFHTDGPEESDHVTMASAYREFEARADRMRTAVYSGVGASVCRILGRQA